MKTIFAALLTMTALAAHAQTFQCVQQDWQKGRALQLTKIKLEPNDPSLIVVAHSSPKLSFTSHPYADVNLSDRRLVMQSPPGNPTGVSMVVELPPGFEHSVVDGQLVVQDLYISMQKCCAGDRSPVFANNDWTCEPTEKAKLAYIQTVLNQKDLPENKDGNPLEFIGRILLP